MGHNSVVSNVSKDIGIGTILGGPLGATAQAAGNLVKDLLPSNNIGSPTPPPTAPNPVAATMDSLQNQLNQEVRMRASNTLATGGTGLIQTPTTAGSMLLGGY